MKIKRIKLTITPDEYAQHLLSFTTEVITDEEMYTVRQLYSENDFESVFDYLIDYAKDKIKKAIKEDQPNQIGTVK